MTPKTWNLTRLRFDKCVQLILLFPCRLPRKRAKSIFLSAGLVFLCTTAGLGSAAAEGGAADKTYLADGWAIQSSAKIQAPAEDDLLAGIQAGELVQGHRSFHRGRQPG